MKVKMEVTESFDEFKLSKKTIYEVAKQFEKKYDFKITHISDDNTITIFVDRFVFQPDIKFKKFINEIKSELRRLENLKRDMELVGIKKCNCGDK
jgi:hypothetical protein